MPRAIFKGERAQYVSIYCPGCRRPHTLGVRPNVSAGPSWEFDGNLELPTISPSIHANPPGQYHIKQFPICHSFVRAGRIEYLSDTTHALSGQTIDLPEYPEDWK